MFLFLFLPRMTDPILNRQSSIFTINTPTRDDVFDFSDVFNFYSDAERTNTPNLMKIRPIFHPVFYHTISTEMAKEMEKRRNIHRLRCSLTIARERGVIMIQVLRNRKKSIY